MVLGGQCFTSYDFLRGLNCSNNRKVASGSTRQIGASSLHLCARFSDDSDQKELAPQYFSLDGSSCSWAHCTAILTPKSFAQCSGSRRCRQTFMVNARLPLLHTHAISKHPDTDPISRFPQLKDFDPDDPKGLKKQAAELATANKKSQRKKKLTWVTFSV